jgi:type I restriction enzyme S subunit
MIKSFQLVNKEGCEWMGEIPSHWNLCSVWILFELGRGRVISNEEISDNAGEFPVYSSQTKSNGVMGHLKTYDFDGDYITWTTDGANAGTVFERHGKFNCTNVCGTLKSKDSAISLTYFRYAIELAAKYFVRHDINPKLMNGVMSRIKVPRPTIREQKSISIFINNKTFEIDRLVREKQKFINLLKEKRQALISHVVTKGLNPDVEMKDSGLLWAPKVPAHWDLKKLSYICKMQSGDSITSEGIEKTGSYRVFGGNGVRGYCEQYNHHGDYILVGRQGSLCGNVNYASGKFFASEHAVVVYPEKSVDMKWLGEALRHDVLTCPSSTIVGYRWGRANNP